MALSETFPPTKSTKNIPHNIPQPRFTKCSTPVRIPITARELVEWTYAEQRAQNIHDASEARQARSSAGVAFDLLTEFKMLGCNVDRSAGMVTRWGETKCHEDALLVRDIACHVLTFRQRLLLRDCGAERSVPDWAPKIFPLRCVPVQGSGGKPRGLYLGSGRLHVGSEIAYEGDWPSREYADRYYAGLNAHFRLWSDPENWPVARRRRSDKPMAVVHDWSPEPWRRCADEVIERARDEYRAWYEALWALRDGLEAAGSRGLRKYRITALGASYEPWSIEKALD